MGIEVQTFDGQKQALNPPAADPVSDSSQASATPAAEDATLANPAGEAPSGESEEGQSTEETEAAEGEPSAEEVEAKGAEEKKKKGGFQRRIDRLNAQKSQAEQERDYWKQMALKGAGPESKPDATPAKPSSEGKPDPEKFDSHAEYVEALADWKVEQKLKAREQSESQRKLQDDQAQVVNRYTERMKAFAEKTPDFDDVVAEVDIPLSAALQNIILTSENGPELAYNLAKNPAELERIAKLDPLACARELGKFEAKLAKSPTSTKNITKAPAPINPVKTGGGKVSKSLSDPNLSQADYERIRRQQLEARRASL